MKHRTVFATILGYVSMIGGCDNRPANVVPSTPSNQVQSNSSRTTQVDATESTESFVIRQLLGIWNEWRARDAWTFIDGWATASKWEPVPPELQPLLGPQNDANGRSYILRKNKTHGILVGFNTDDNVVTVAIAGPADLTKIRELLAEAMTLESLGVFDELGQKTQMYAAVHGTERIGLVTITEGTHSTTNDFASVGIIDWRSAIRVVPSSESVFVELERRSASGR